MSDKTMTGLTLRLEIEVKYELNGEDPIALECALGEAALILYEDGRLSGTTDAEVVNWGSRVVRVGEVMSDQEKE